MNGDGCDENCITEANFICTGDSQMGPDTCEEKCGDARNDGLKECDDGNLLDYDGCSAECVIETGYECANAGLGTRDTCTEICGDGLWLERYACDGFCGDGVVTGDE